MTVSVCGSWLTAGPTVLSVLLLTAIVVNFVLRFNE